jgi:hypothetical protein
MGIAKIDKARQQELMRDYLDSKSVGMVKKVVTFIENHWEDEDKDFRRDAHKLLHKYFDAYVPKKQVIENKTEVVFLDERIDKAINYVAMEEHKRLEVEEAVIISPEEAKNARNAK